MSRIETGVWTCLVVLGAVGAVVGQDLLRTGMTAALCDADGCVAPAVQGLFGWLSTGAPIAVFLTAYVRLGARPWLIRAMMVMLLVMAVSLAVPLSGDPATRAESGLHGFGIGVMVSLVFLTVGGFAGRVTAETMARREKPPETEVPRADRGRRGRFNAPLYHVIAAAQVPAGLVAVVAAATWS
ncbi:hypothetical protein LX16_3176 [Stackebrandtia albiflava]|uniref:DUF998 domain-containing protein n=2 Tax=Stackebrandtia albiflava TaxID=406432 RepID=A0A562V3E0_9ACTN|nr:hypothetical protein LX16_3176 [Stackebrandtia albiflava]